jgi:hypothetical protein
VDISPGGVGFLAGAPLEEDEPICFTISGKSVPMTEAAGELMWRDSAGKRAGVRFTHVPEGLREVINHLSIKHLSIKAPINHSHTFNHTFSHMPISHTPTNHTFDHTPIRHSQPEKNNPSRGIENIATPAVGANKVAAPLSATRKRFGAVANAMTAALALFMAAAIWFPLNRHGLPGSMKTLEHTASQMGSRVRSYRLKFANVHAAGAREEGSFALESHALSGGPVLPRVGKTDGAAPARAKRGKGQTARRPSRQTDGSGSEDVAESPESLWQAVEKGSSEAEIKLADMYLEANGVEKSCSQAEVLLAAAQRHKSALAVQKLANLAGYGCE